MKHPMCPFCASPLDPNEQGLAYCDSCDEQVQCEEAEDMDLDITEMFLNDEDGD